jgi:hypothetical protein
MTSDDFLPFTPVEKIRFGHDTESFQCGYPELERFLKHYAIVNQKAGTAQTYSDPAPPILIISIAW